MKVAIHVLFFFSWGGGGGAMEGGYGEGGSYGGRSQCTCFFVCFVFAKWTEHVRIEK